MKDFQNAMIAGMVALLLFGCSAFLDLGEKDTNAFEKCLVAATTYDTLQIGIEAAVIYPGVDPDIRATLQKIDLEATGAIVECETAATTNNGDDAALAAAVLERLIVLGREAVAVAEVEQASDGITTTEGE